jgi:hypothetical protein
MSKRITKFSFPDAAKGIRRFEVDVEAIDETAAVVRLADYLTELKSTCFRSPPVPVSDSANPKVVGQELIRRLKAITDPIAFIVTLHLFTEHWLNQILLKHCPKHDLKRHNYFVKLKQAHVLGKLTDDLVHNLTKLNLLRNHVAHRLDYDLTTMDLDYRGCPPDFELRRYRPTFDAAGEQHHISNVLVGVMSQTYMLLHQHCVSTLGFSRKGQK